MSSSGRIARRVCVLLACMLVLLFVVKIRKYYHPGLGFTALLGMPAGHDYELPAFRAVPHVDYPAGGDYDGQFYVQRALDPLVRDPLSDRAMDLAPFRARRILFSWTAYLIGLGHPPWIIETYALQNVVCWLLLAVLLARWMPPSTPRGLAAWTACLFSHGLLWSVRFALLDGPSLVLIALAIILSERGRMWASAAVAGISGLARETNVLAALALPLPTTLRGGVKLAAAAALVLLPLLVWEDYLYSIYRSTIFAGAGGPVLTLHVAFFDVLRAAWAHVRAAGLFSPAGLDLCILGSLLLQAVVLVARPAPGDAWWRVGIGYVALLLVMDHVLVSPATGAITRVMLPMTAAYNVLLVRNWGGKGFWALFLGGNLHLLPGLRVL